MQLRTFSVVAAIAVAFLVAPASATVAIWDRQVTAMDLPTLSRTVGQPGQPAWPMLRANGKPSPELTLAIKLLQKIEASEAANASFSPNVAPQLVKTYLDLANAIRGAGGHDNLLLADTLDRLAMVRLGRWAFERPADLPKAREIAATMSPIVTPDTFPLIVQAETNLQPADVAPPRAGTNPAQAMPRQHVSELLVQQIMAVNYKLQQASRPPPGVRQAGLMPVQPLPVDQGGHRTVHLLNSPSFESLISRMRSRDYFLVLTLPGLFNLVEKGVTLDKVYEDSKRAADSVPQDRTATPRSDLFADFRPELVPALRTIAYPGVGTYFSNVYDFAYANAIDPPAQTKGEVSLAVTEKVLSKLGPKQPAMAQVVITPSGNTWAALQSSPPKPGNMALMSRVVINGQSGPELSIGSIGEQFGMFAIASPAGEKIAYVGADQKSARVYVNHRPGPVFSRIDPKSLMFSDDGLVMAYIGFENQVGSYVVVGANRYGPYGHVSCLAISANGRRAAWLATPPPQQQQGGQPRAGVPGSQPALNLRQPAGDETSVYVDGRKVDVHARIETGRSQVPPFATRRIYAPVSNRVVISDDGTRWAYCTNTPQGLVTRVAGKNPVDYRFPAPPMGFSPDGATLLSFPVGQSGIVINGAPVPGLGGDINNWVALADEPFGPDGTVRYKTLKASGVIKPDGKIIATYSGSSYFSDAGKRVISPVGQTARSPYPDPRAKLVFDLGNGRTTKPAGGNPNGWRPQFGPDERFYQVAEVDEHIEIIAEGDAWPAVSGVGSLSRPDGPIAFNPDGRYAAASIRRGWAWRLSVNGCETAEKYDGILGAQFTATGLRGLAIRDDQLIEVTARITDIKPQKPAANLASAQPIAPQANPAVGNAGAGTAPVPAGQQGGQTTAPTVGQPAQAGAAEAGAPAQPVVVQAANQWKRTTVVASTRSQDLAAFVIGGQPAIMHLKTDAPGKSSLVVTQRRGGGWVTKAVDNVPPSIRQFSAVAIDDVIYVAISHGDEGGRGIHTNSIRVLAGRNDKWTVEWDRSDSDHYGMRPAMGVAGGQPFVIYSDTGAKSAHLSSRAIYAARDKAGKWTGEGVPLPRNAGIYYFVTAEVDGMPAFSFGPDGGFPRQFVIRRDGKWTTEELKGMHRVGAVLPEADGPSVVGNAYCQRKADGWTSVPFYDQKDVVVGFDGKVIAGVPTVAYLIRERNELHVRRRVNGVWDDQLVDYGSTNGDKALSIFELKSGFGIVYVANGPSGAMIVLLEPKK